jgi:hypothetical protein
VNQPTTSAPGFLYSKAMKVSGVTWVEPALTAFLAKPKKFMKSTKMSFAGINNAKKRASLLAYLQTLTDAQTTATKHGYRTKCNAASSHTARFLKASSVAANLSLAPISKISMASWRPATQIMSPHRPKKRALIETDTILTETMASPE